jgi:hypothetical protein
MPTSAGIERAPVAPHSSWWSISATMSTIRPSMALRWPANSANFSNNPSRRCTGLTPGAKEAAGEDIKSSKQTGTTKQAVRSQGTRAIAPSIVDRLARGLNVPMTPPVIQRWIDIIDNHRPEDLDALLADDAVFYSPAVFSPQEGKVKTALYLRAAEKMFSATDFQYVGQWFGERSAVLEFAATVDGIYVNGVDMIEWNEDELIVSFKVMLRPYKALSVIMPKMAELLQPS